MKKGKYGIQLTFYAVLAFLFVIIDQPLLCFAVMAAALFIEKDEWLGRQTIQAMTLSVVYRVVNELFGGISRGIPHNFDNFLSFLSGAFSLIGGLCGLLVLVLCIIGIVNVSRERDAGIPVLTGLAYHAYGKTRPARYAAPAQNVYPQPPVQQIPPQQPYYQQPPQGYPHNPAANGQPAYSQPAQPPAPVVPPASEPQSGTEANKE